MGGWYIVRSWKRILIQEACLLQCSFAVTVAWEVGLILNACLSCMGKGGTSPFYCSVWQRLPSSTRDGCCGYFLAWRFSSYSFSFSVHHPFFFYTHSRSFHDFLFLLKFKRAMFLAYISLGSLGPKKIECGYHLTWSQKYPPKTEWFNNSPTSVIRFSLELHSHEIALWISGMGNRDRAISGGLLLCNLTAPKLEKALISVWCKTWIKRVNLRKMIRDRNDLRLLHSHWMNRSHILGRSILAPMNAP